MTDLTREMILAVNDIVLQPIEVPEWGGTVYVRSLTGKERDLFEQSTMSVRGRKMSVNLANARARLVSLGCADVKGERLFSLSDIEALGKKSAVALDRVANAIQVLSGLTNRDMGELTANFMLGLNAGSISDLPSPSEE